MKELTITQFGNPILRKKAKKLTKAEIKSSTIQQLIKNMQHTLKHKKLGVGLAAPQVSKSMAIVVIEIQPTPHRPKVTPFSAVLINPVIKQLGTITKDLWEGCISAGSHGTADLFAKVPRSTRVVVEFFDQHGEKHEKSFTGLKAQIVQHEVDHLNGLLFVDRVQDTKTFMTYSEYMQHIKTSQ